MFIKISRFYETRHFQVNLAAALTPSNVGVFSIQVIFSLLTNIQFSA